MKPKNKKNKILIIHGPNLHLLGVREPHIYGKFTLCDLNKELKEKVKKNNLAVKIIQSNSEGEIVEEITNTNYEFLIINPAAYTHTSVAIRDALLGIKRPAIEVHLSNIYKREEFRKKSLISDVVLGVITGLGKHSYLLAIEAAICFLNSTPRR
ncbi:MAG: type II 3-dehydroquinate dehydratase [Candidatus Omnitrophica bacterium]|nr:type II 3-dehydroquinate dehydratase [Candidatus Omnitrophota bacterium]MBU0879070.1 type II 3-dehydroquinate dehydratase [Candidatus Omnitrophota bacterium]MBU0897229.1 type II 3-dehydroquinate dehydratase [Candidatus Omnitrophota bacterium]MBU1134735.1 type II 3-dehydroquinate dehydratase [Candidatus Omnitrophota bacterium]MBU1366741.1 type II 3-dehydroquinate dehydratase [Candidatus Omnitrophota bacterium]